MRHTWTSTETQFLRENYEKLTYKQISAHLGIPVDKCRSKANALDIVNRRGPSEEHAAGVPMEEALTPEQAPVMRDFLCSLVHYSKRGKVDVAYFMQLYREKECGFVYGNNRDKRITA